MTARCRQMFAEHFCHCSEYVTEMHHRMFASMCYMLVGLLGFPPPPPSLSVSLFWTSSLVIFFLEGRFFPVVVAWEAV